MLGRGSFDSVQEKDLFFLFIVHSNIYNQIIYNISICMYIKFIQYPNFIQHTFNISNPISILDVS